MIAVVLRNVIQMLASALRGTDSRDCPPDEDFVQHGEKLRSIQCSLVPVTRDFPIPAPEGVNRSAGDYMLPA